MSAHDVVAEIVPLIETSAAARDETLARPVEYAAGILYGWPVRDVLAEAGDGSLDEGRFTIRLAYAVSAEAELAAAARERATTDTLRTYVAAIGAWVRAHRSGTWYEDLQITAVDWEALVTNSVRGAIVELAGYRLTS